MHILMFSAEKTNRTDRSNVVQMTQRQAKSSWRRWQKASRYWNQLDSCRSYVETICISTDARVQSVDENSHFALGERHAKMHGISQLIVVSILEGKKSNSWVTTKIQGWLQSMPQWLLRWCSFRSRPFYDPFRRTWTVWLCHIERRYGVSRLRRFHF